MKCTALKQPLEPNQYSLNTLPQNQTPYNSMQKQKIKIKLAFSKKKFHPPSHQKKSLTHNNTSLNEEFIKAEIYLSTIEDSLWKHVCRDIINMMGPASFLKIWESTLGELSYQNKSIPIYAKTEEAAQFIQKYDFVIFGNLQPYFPTLKQLKISPI